MFIKDNKRFNIWAPATIDGVQYGNFLDPELRISLGIIEIPDPEIPEDFSDETYYRTEQDDFPYIVYTKKSDEQLEQVRKSKVLQEIAQLEAGQGRAVREAALGNPTYLQLIDNKIKALRDTL